MALYRKDSWNMQSMEFLGLSTNNYGLAIKMDLNKTNPTSSQSIFIWPDLQTYFLHG
jgi:hypothetical protein